jgi:4-amino-4-deoxy-L-arabinose transferase-like glycosyltransferase
MAAGGRLLARARVIPRAVWGITTIFTLVLVGWSLVTPRSEAPDEAFHADLVFHLAAGGSYPAWDKRKIGRPAFSIHIFDRPGSTITSPPLSLTPESAPRRLGRRSFEALGGDTPTSYPNQQTQHPPLYYQGAAVALRVERALVPGSSASIESEWHFLRLLHVLLLAPFPLLCWGAARRLGGSRRVGITAATIPIAIPELTHIGSAVNNDALLILLGGVLAFLLAGVIRGDARRGTALAIGAVTGLAILTKAFALLFPIWVAIAYAVPALRDRARRSSSLRNVVIASATSALVGGWWWLRHWIETGSLSPSMADRVYTDRPRPPGFTPDPLAYAPQFVWKLAERFWGHLGYFSARMGLITLIVATLVAGAAILAAFLPRRRPRQPRALEMAAFGSVILLLVGLTAFHAYQLYAQSGETPFIQGRYLFAAIVPLAVLLAIGLDRMVGRWTPIAVLGGALVMQIDAVHAALTNWWGEPTASLARSIDAFLAWLPTPSVIVWILTIALLAATAATAWELARASA